MFGRKEVCNNILFLIVDITDNMLLYFDLVERVNVQILLSDKLFLYF